MKTFFQYIIEDEDFGVGSILGQGAEQFKELGVDTARALKDSLLNNRYSRNATEMGIDWEEWSHQAKQGLLPDIPRSEFEARWRGASIGRTSPSLPWTENTDAGYVRGAPQRAQSVWKNYRPDMPDAHYEGMVQRHLTAPDTVQPPVVVRTAQGDHLLSGNTRAMIHSAHSPETPMRVRTIDMTRPVPLEGAGVAMRGLNPLGMLGVVVDTFASPANVDAVRKDLPPLEMYSSKGAKDARSMLTSPFVLRMVQAAEKSFDDEWAREVEERHKNDK